MDNNQIIAHFIGALNTVLFLAYFGVAGLVIRQILSGENGIYLGVLLLVLANAIGRGWLVILAGIFVFNDPKPETITYLLAIGVFTGGFHLATLLFLGWLIFGQQHNGKQTRKRS